MYIKSSERMFVLLASILVFLSTCEGCNITSVGKTWQYNEDVDSLVTGVADADLCMEECQKSEGCMGYTWQSEGILELCFLFQNLTEPQDCINCISGTIPILKTGEGCVVDYAHILSQASANSSKECLDLCGDLVKCREFLYFDESAVLQNICFMYDYCPEVATCQNCESGILNCISGGGGGDDFPAQCEDYMELSDQSRLVSNAEGPYFCDQTDRYTSPDWQGSGWYRITSGDGVLPNQNPGHNSCGTVAPGYTTSDLPPVGEATNGPIEVCFAGQVEDCLWSVTANVTSCEDFLLFYLPETPECDLRYCAQ